MEKIEALNGDPAVNGILVQLPLDTDNKIDVHAVSVVYKSNKEYRQPCISNCFVKCCNVGWE